MGTWALDWAGPGGNVPRMFYFNGDVFNSGVFRRTPPTWTQTFVTQAGRACVWDNRMWAAGAVAMSVHSSTDGIVWTEDWRPGYAPLDYWSGFNAYDAYLRVASRSSGPGPANHFFRRDRYGTWTETPVGQADPNHFDDIISYGGYVYLTDGLDGYRWPLPDGTAWQTEPVLDPLLPSYFTEHGGMLYCRVSKSIYRRSTTGNWVQDMTPLAGAWGLRGAISVGGDGVLYVVAEDGANSRVYARVGGRWILHSTIAGVRFSSVIADASGNLFAGTNTGAFYAYTADFAVTPVGLGLYPQAMDVDGDGNAIYVGLYNAAAQPVLVKVAAPLVHNAMGNAVFNPLDGDAINVECGDVGGELAISGNFAAAGNEQVEVSEDGGATWTDIDRDFWGADTAQPLLVDPDDAANVVMVALATARDITETFDGGGTAWTVNNAAVGYSPAAMAKLPEGDELVVGNAHAARKVEYSPNRGVTLQDITGGAAIGNVVALEVA